MAVAQKIYEEILANVPEAIIETKVGAEGEKMLPRLIILLTNIIYLVTYTFIHINVRTETQKIVNFVILKTRRKITDRYEQRLRQF